MLEFAYTGEVIVLDSLTGDMGTHPFLMFTSTWANISEKSLGSSKMYF